MIRVAHVLILVVRILGIKLLPPNWIPILLGLFHEITSVFPDDLP